MVVMCEPTASRVFVEGGGATFHAFPCYNCHVATVCFHLPGGKSDCHHLNKTKPSQRNRYETVPPLEDLQIRKENGRNPPRKRETLVVAPLPPPLWILIVAEKANMSGRPQGP